MSSCETAPDSWEPEWVPTGLGSAYDRAVARMIRTNHELECRQADLARLRRLGAPGWAIARVDRAVQQLGDDYARAIEAITHVRG